MQEIKLCKRMLKDEYGEPDVEIKTYCGKEVSANALEVEAGTTGYKGGDSGNGCRAYFRIENFANSDLRVNAYNKGSDLVGIEVTTGGDTELYTLIEALKFIVNVLENGETGANDKFIGK